MDDQEAAASVERLACGLAHLAGISWQRPERCPPQLRGRLREEARALLRTLDAVDRRGPAEPRRGKRTDRDG